jgi:hypothetical protein
MTRDDFMQLCERAAEFCDVCAECTVTITKCTGDVISMSIKNNTVIVYNVGHIEEGSSHPASIA